MPAEMIHNPIDSLLLRPRSRRHIITGGLRLGGMSVLAAGAWPVLSRLAVAAQAFKGDVDVLNYALTLEHLEFAFYRDGVANLSFGSGPFGESIDANFAMFRDHEAAHVRTLTATIKKLGGTPVAEATYDFGYGNDPQKFLATARALENTGVSAYDGAASALTSADLLTAASTIVAVEARHAAYLDLLSGQVPFPAPFEQPASRADVLKIAGAFITGGGTPGAGS